MEMAPSSSKKYSAIRAARSGMPDARSAELRGSDASASNSSSSGEVRAADFAAGRGLARGSTCEHSSVNVPADRSVTEACGAAQSADPTCQPRTRARGVNT